MDGINTDKSTPVATSLRASNDPVCSQFYSNVIEAANKSARAKNTNSQFATAGVSIAGAVVGLGPAGAIATNTAARVLLTQTITEVPTTTFDPEERFDKRIIDTAAAVNCPITIKGQKTP